MRKMELETLRKEVPKRTKFPLSITRKRGIDHLVSGYSPGKVEGEKEVEENPDIAAAFAQYKEMLRVSDIARGDLIKELDIILNPRQVEAFVLRTSPDHHLPNFFYSGEFFSKLIQNSYEAGYNDFNFDTQNRIIHYLPYNCQGSKERPLSLTIHGELGIGFADNVEHLNIALHGTLGYKRFARYAFHCTFKTSNMEALFYFVRNLTRNNEVIFIHKNGEEEPVTHLSKLF